MLVKSAVLSATENRQAARQALPPPPPEDDTTFNQRAANLTFAGAKPSNTELERLMGTNDLVDEFYLQRALIAAEPVMRLTLRDPAGRERGWATGFMVSPRLLLTNWHVFPNLTETENAIAEAHYVLDLAGNPAPSYRFAVQGDQYYFSNEALDFALVAIAPLAQDGLTTLTRFGYHRLIGEPNKIRVGESMTLIQHPGGERRQFAIRDNQLSEILDQFLWYQSDTAPGSSGAPAFNDSFQVVALHHSGAARRDAVGNYILRDGQSAASLDGIDDSRVDWVANEGLRISVLCAFIRANLSEDHPLVHEFFQAMLGGDVMSNAISENAPSKAVVTTAPQPEVTTIPSAPAALVVPNGTVLTIPLQLQISLSLGGNVALPLSAPSSTATVTMAPPTSSMAQETLRYPVVDRHYASRVGYKTDFLGIPAPLPQITDGSLVARMSNGQPEIPYEHFTVIVNKQRRLPLFTGSNIDYAPAKRQPDAGDYTRKGLTGLGDHDLEKWLVDPRIPAQDQLPNVFYDKDRQSFDKGHIVARDDVCWGTSHKQIQRANGDTFHVTNCTPQVLGFNRSGSGVDNWGDLENEIKKQAKTDKLSILSGPILAATDPLFRGFDDIGEVEIQVPVKFWKVVLANSGGHLAAYAFILKQDLANVPVEFSVNAAWRPFQVSVTDLEAQLSGFKFPPEVHTADQIAVPLSAGAQPGSITPDVTGDSISPHH